MLKLVKRNNKGVEMNPMVAAAMLAVSLIVGGGVTLLVIPMINRSRDSTIQEDLKAMSTAMNQFLVETNGEAPCLDSVTQEGAAGPVNTGICNGNSYNYEQGSNPTADPAIGNLDKDTKEAETMTVYSVLTPKFVTSIPSAPYNGDHYYYTKGDNDSNDYSKSFAFSALLHSDNADDMVKKNQSVLNAMEKIEANWSPTSANMAKACKASDLKNNGRIGAIIVPNPAAGDGSIFAKTYYGVNQLTVANLYNATITAAPTTACDLFSAGLVTAEAFDVASPTITVN